MIVRRIAPLSVAKIAAMIYAVLGLVFGAVFSLIALAGALASDLPRGGGFGAMLAAGGIVLFPIFYGAMGFVVTLVGAWLYNVAAGVVGGIEIEVE